MSKLPLRPGDQIGDWKIERVLGEGGMGAVFRAQHAMIPDVFAAVKIMKPGQIDDAAERFLREVRAVLRLNHPNIVRVSGFGRDARRDLLWMAMDLVEGGDLEGLITRGAMDLQAVLVMFAGLAEALAHAHDQGVFHRDLKPSNVLIDAHGRARLVDFGIAVQQTDSRLTSTGIVIGTPAYLPPELFGGEEADPALGDLYAFGQMMFEAATGSPAFPVDPTLADSQRLVRLMGQKVRSDHLDPGDGFPDGFRALVRDLTEPEPENRLASAAELTARLASLVRTGGHAVRPVPSPRPPRPRRGRLVGWLAAGGAAVILLGGLAAVTAAAVGVVAWTSMGESPAEVASVAPDPEPATVVDLTHDEAFRAVGEAIETSPCAEEVGGGSHRAKIKVHVEDGKIVRADALEGYGTAAFAQCLATEVYRDAVDLDDGQGVWSFAHTPAPKPARRATPKRSASPTTTATPAEAAVVSVEPKRPSPPVEPTPEPEPATPSPPTDPPPEASDASEPRTAEDIYREFLGAVTKVQTPIQRCYYRAQSSQPDLKGSIFLAFDLMPDGSTQNVKVVRSELNHAEVERCAVEGFSEIRMRPRPNGRRMRQPSFELKLGTRR